MRRLGVENERLSLRLARCACGASGCRSHQSAPSQRTLETAAARADARADAAEAENARLRAALVLADHQPRREYEAIIRRYRLAARRARTRIAELEVREGNPRAFIAFAAECCGRRDAHLQLGVLGEARR